MTLEFSVELKRGERSLFQVTNDQQLHMTFIETVVLFTGQRVDVQASSIDGPIEMSIRLGK